MAKLLISEVIQPPVWIPYMRQMATKLNRMLRSGIVVANEALQAKVVGGGAPFINMPNWNPLTGSSQVLSDSSPLSVAGIGKAKQIAYALARGDARSVNDLAGIRSGDDPARAIAEAWAQWWNEDEQAILIAILSGMIADNKANDDSDLVSAIFSEDGVNAIATNKISGSAVITAAQKMGDAKGKLAAIVMHSQVEANLATLDQITAIRDSEGKILYNAYKGLEVLVDDTVPVRVGTTSGHVYTTYLAARGAISRADYIPTENGVEFDRDILAGDTVMAMRRHLVLHPTGYAAKYAAGDLAGDTAANSELAVAGAWDRVWERKNTGVVAIESNG